MPADGVVVQGNSSVNEAMITGEALPVAKVEGDRIIGGTINGPGVLWGLESILHGEEDS